MERVEEDPPGWDEESPLLFDCDGEILDTEDRWVFGGVTAFRIGSVTESDLAALDLLDLPRVDCPEAGRRDATVADVLRWAKRHVAAQSEPLEAPR